MCNGQFTAHQSHRRGIVPERSEDAFLKLVRTISIWGCGMHNITVRCVRISVKPRGESTTRLRNYGVYCLENQIGTLQAKTCDLMKTFIRAEKRCQTPDLSVSITSAVAYQPKLPLGRLSYSPKYAVNEKKTKCVQFIPTRALPPQVLVLGIRRPDVMRAF